LEEGTRPLQDADQDGATGLLGTVIVVNGRGQGTYDRSNLVVPDQHPVEVAGIFVRITASLKVQVSRFIRNEYWEIDGGWSRHLACVLFLVVVKCWVASASSAQENEVWVVCDGRQGLTRLLLLIASYEGQTVMKNDNGYTHHATLEHTQNKVNRLFHPLLLGQSK
jgi:hypothetical protein